MFDLVVLAVFALTCAVLGGKAPRYFFYEKLFSGALIFLTYKWMQAEMFHLLFAIECFLFMSILVRNLDGFNILKFTVAAMSLAHSAVVVGYYSLPHDHYLTVYNYYPAAYLILVALQILGLIHGSTRQRIFFNWHTCAVGFVRPIDLLCRASVKRVKT